MSAAKHAYLQSLDEFVQEPILVGNGIADLEKETQENLLSVSLTPAVAKECSLSDFLRFFDLLTDQRRKQIKKFHGRKMRVFSWFDEQSGELKINFISSENITLPFDTPVVDAPLADIITEFLQSKKTGAMQARDPEAAVVKKSVVNTPKPPLPVFQAIL